MAGTVTTLIAALALTGIALFTVYVAMPNFWGIVQDNVPGQRMGVVGGFIHAEALADHRRVFADEAEVTLHDFL